MPRWPGSLIAVACAALGGCGVEDRTSSADGHTASTITRLESQMDDATYLYQLGLMRGHLLVGNALFELGERTAANTHSKHPADELYASMEAEFTARRIPGFARQLEAHAEAVNRGDGDGVEAQYADLMAAIAEHEAVVEVAPELAREVIVRLLREAGAEYAVGIVDGKPANAHEYQDAYGFTQVAAAWAQRAAARHPDHRSFFDRVGAEIAGLADMWPSLMPPPEVPHLAARLHNAAADVETAAEDLRR